MYLVEILPVRMNLPGKISNFVCLRKKMIVDIIIFIVTKGPHLVCMFSVIRKVRTVQNCPS